MCFEKYMVIKKVGSVLRNDGYGNQLKIIVFFLLTLYAWHQSHFQFQEYWSEPYRSLTYYFLTFIVLVVAAISILNKHSYENIYFVGVYILLVLFYGFLQYVLYQENILIYAKSIAVLLVALLIIKSKENLYTFIKINFFLGITLIVLNTVTLFHWLDVFELSYEQVSRVGGTNDRPDLDPYSFGIFGRTESYIGAGSIAPRLQGFSSEPLHWAYFVLMSFSMGLLLYAQTNNRKLKIFLSFCFIVMLTHSYFLKSTTIYISIIYIALCFIMMLVLFKLDAIKKYKKISSFLALVLVPGFFIPFALVLMSNAEQLFHTESLFSEKSNWEGKIDFLYLGKQIFMQFLPSGNSYLPISHNLVLDTYLKFGYLLIMPLMFFIYEFVNVAISNDRYSNLAVYVFLVTATLASPFTIFSPSGALWAATIYGAAYHSKLTGKQA